MLFLSKIILNLLITYIELQLVNLKVACLELPSVQGTREIVKC